MIRYALFLCSLALMFTADPAAIAYAASAGEAVNIMDRLAELESQIKAQQTNSNHIWTMVAATLVFFMQGGFLLLEAGMVRSKNSINVAQKKIADFIVAGVAFYVIGFILMFAPTHGGWFGWTGDWFLWNEQQDWHYTFFIFQLVFAGTSATILSGAVAERMKFGAYILMSCLLAAFIYPVFGHWAWVNLLVGENSGYLLDKGFIDFAGSTVVHSIGGWVALAGVIVIGPRIGKFNEDGSVNPINGHSYALATLGAIILWIGWIGFNGGSTTAGTPAFAHIISNTVLAGCFGGLIAMLLGRFHDGLFRPDRSINGVLGALVGITAGCDAVSTYGAIAIGVSSGFVVYYGALLLEHKFKLDDAVGAIPVHGLCGAWGTIAVALFATESALVAGTRMDQLIIQAQGVAIAFVWAFSLAYITFKLLHITAGIRVSPEEEEEGLNTSEHGTTLGTGLLQKHLKDIVFGDGDLTRRLDANTGDESAEVAWLFNSFMDKIQTFVVNIKTNSQELYKSSQQLSEVATAMASSSEELEAQAKSVAGSTDKVSEKMGTASSNVNSVTGDINVISDNARQMSESISEMSQAVETLTTSISGIADNANEASGVSKESAEMARLAASTVETLNTTAIRIVEFVSIIQEISERTNLLALNATIEATRAGDAGKGFAVVASEVKQLSRQTGEAAKKIATQVGEIQTQTGDVVNAIGDIGRIIHTINDAVTLISEAANVQRDAASQISEKISRSSENAQDVAVKVESMSEKSAEISEDIQIVSGEAHAVAENIKGFSEEAKGTAGNAAILHERANNLAKTADNLSKAVSAFKTD